MRIMQARRRGCGSSSGSSLLLSLLVGTTALVDVVVVVQASSSLTRNVTLERTELDIKLPKALSDHTATTVINDNMIYVAGGCDSPDGNVFVPGDVEQNTSAFFYCPSISNSFYAFDPTDKTFLTLPDLPRPRYRHAAVSIDNHIFFVGGRDVEDNLIQQVDVFDITTRDWATEILPEGYATSDLAGWGAGTRAYFVGGYNPLYEAQSSVWGIDVAKYRETGEPEIEDFAPIQFPRGDIAASVNLEEGYAYVSGGFSHENDFCEPLDSVERYSLAGDTWINVARLPTARADKAMVTYEGHTISMGGERQIENKCELEEPAKPGELTIAVDDIEMLNDDDSTWERLEPLPEHRFRFAAAVHGDTIYTFGGQQAYDEGCNCLKTVDEVIAYTDIAPEGPEKEDGEGEEGKEGGDIPDDEDQDTVATSDEVSTPGEAPGESAAGSIFCKSGLVSLMMLIFGI